MPLWNPGNQTVTILTTGPKLDGNGNPVKSELNITQTTNVRIVKTGCVFEVELSAMPGRAEDVTPTATTMKQTAWVIFPYDTDTAAIKVGDQLEYQYRVFNMRGDAIVEVDMLGTPSHVFAMCEYQA
jgi:hypothetical protein